MGSSQSVARASAYEEQRVSSGSNQTHEADDHQARKKIVQRGIRKIS